MGGVLSRVLRVPRAMAIGLAAAVAAGCTALAPVLGGDGLPGTAPACSWPLRVAGHATAAQAGLVRC